MIQVRIEWPASEARTLQCDQSTLRIGRSRECEVVLQSWRVGRIHATVQRVGETLRLMDGGTFSGTAVNGARVLEYAPLTADDAIEIGGFRLRMAWTVPSPQTEVPAGQQVSDRTSHEALVMRRRVHQALLARIDLRRRDMSGLDPSALRSEVSGLLEQVFEDLALPPGLDRERLTTEILDETLGLGPLERLLDDPSISEIMVNACDELWVERGGRLERHPASFSDDDAVRGVIERIVTPLGRRIDESSPMVDARLPDGSRVNAIIPPLAIRGPAITIRRFNRALLSPADLIAAGSASTALFEFLQLCVLHRRNIVISGGTGSGKTTLLNVLSNLIPAQERIVTIEDAAELTLQHPHRVQLEARPPNLEHRGEITIRDLVRNALRMRPDRIIVGECRGGETLDMLQAMNTGHDGSLTTVHANGPREVVSRLEVMTLMAGMEIPVQAIREQIASAIDLIVHQARMSDGRRRIQSVMEVTGIESGRVQMQPLFEWCPRAAAAGGSPSAGFQGCDTVPSFYEALRAAGVSLDLRLFHREMQ